MVRILKKFKTFLIAKLRGEISTNHLIKKGLKVGKNFSRQKGCIIDYSHCWLITIGDNVTFAPNVHVLAHDASTKFFLNYVKIGLVYIGSNVFVGAGSIVLPNVRIGDNVIIGAGSVVTNDIPSNSLVVGNPAKVIGSVSDYINKNKELMNKRPLYDEKWTVRSNILPHQKVQMIKDLQDGIGYVE